MELLREVREADREAPLWAGVKDIRADNGAVRVQFAKRYEPALLPVRDSRVEVSCHLYHDPREGRPDP